MNSGSISFLFEEGAMGSVLFLSEAEASTEDN
jgi:hypothetical protein